MLTIGVTLGAALPPPLIGGRDEVMGLAGCPRFSVLKCPGSRQLCPCPTRPMRGFGVIPAVGHLAAPQGEAAGSEQSYGGILLKAIWAIIIDRVTWGEFSAFCEFLPATSLSNLRRTAMEFAGDPSEWAVVMPSIRTINVDYLAGIPPEVAIIVVDDSNGGIEPNRENMTVYRYADYRKVFGEDEDLIPRKTDTCRSFGFYMAWRQGYRYIVTLDDDCVTHPGFLAAHSILGEHREVKSVASDPWYNTLDNLVLYPNGESSRHWYARGFPYWCRVEPPQSPRFHTASGQVVCNIGMWLQVPDINGLDKIEQDIPSGTAMRV